MKLKEIFQSIAFKRIATVLGIIIATLLVFQAGMFVGFKKAGFSYNWGDNYYRTFDGHDRKGPPMMPGMQGDNFMNSHGTIGKIIKIELPSVFVQDMDKSEKSILIKEDTSIRKFKDDIKAEDLKIDDTITVVGTPNENSQIEAKLIRILPEPPQGMMQINKSQTDIQNGMNPPQGETPKFNPPTNNPQQ